MIYRRPPFSRRRYQYGNNPPAYYDGNAATIPEDMVIDTERIPLPNERDADVEPVRGPRFPVLPSFLRNIQLDDIILIGLIFIFLQEGIEDEIILILLVYLLLS